MRLRKKLASGKQGMTLVAVVLLIVFASLTVLAITTFIVQRLALIEVKSISTRAVNLANAGVHYAVYHYRSTRQSGNGYFPLGRYDIDANNYFVLGGGTGADADLLMVNTANAVLVSGNKTLAGLSIQNATISKTITIDRMVVTWNAPGGESNSQLTRIRIGSGQPVWNGPPLPSPADANIDNFTLSGTPPNPYSLELRFSADMQGYTVSITFVMTDGSKRTVNVYPASNNFNFTVKSTGKTSASNIYRTIQADCNAYVASTSPTLPLRIFNESEISVEMLPP